MGMIEYYCQHLPRVDIKHSEPFTWWIQGNGKKIKVSKMTDTHLINSINKIDRDKWRTQWKEYLMKELESR